MALSDLEHERQPVYIKAKVGDLEARPMMSMRSSRSLLWVPLTVVALASCTPSDRETASKPALTSTTKDEPAVANTPMPALEPEEPHPTSQSEGYRLLQTLLDSPELRAYLHPQEPGRLPVVVAISPMPNAAPPLLAFGQPVVFKSPEAARGDGGPFLEITMVSFDGSRARILFELEFEGIQGDTSFELRDATWHILRVSIVESSSK